MAAKKSKRTVKKLKNLNVKAKDVRGGAADRPIKFGGVDGESLSSGHDKSTP